MAMMAVATDIARLRTNQFVGRATAPRVDKRTLIDTSTNRESNHPAGSDVGMKVGTARPFGADYRRLYNWLAETCDAAPAEELASKAVPAGVLASTAKRRIIEHGAKRTPTKNPEFPQRATAALSPVLIPALALYSRQPLEEYIRIRELRRLGHRARFHEQRAIHEVLCTVDRVIAMTRLARR